MKEDIAATKEHVGIKRLLFNSPCCCHKLFSQIIHRDEGIARDGQDSVLNTGTGVAGKERPARPITIRLAQNFPNPFNPSTTIQFELPKASQVEITIFNTRGQKVRSLMSSFLSPGEHQVEWYGRVDAGNKVSSGVYFYTLKSGQVYKMMKMILAQ